MFTIYLLISDAMTQMVHEETKLRKQLDEVNQQMTDGQANIEILGINRAKKIDELKKKVQELERQEGECDAAIADLSTQKTSLEHRLDELAKEKSHIEYSVRFLTQRDPSLPEVKVEIPEDIQPILLRFQDQKAKVDYEIQTAHQHSEQVIASFKRAQEKLPQIRLAVADVKGKFDTLVSSVDTCYSEQMKELVAEQKALIASCSSLEKKLSDVVKKIRLLRLNSLKIN